MPIAKRYQDLVCWQLADELEQLVLELTATGPISKDFKFRNQIEDSASSATRCIAEGFARFWPREHAQYLRFACGSLMETHNSVGTGLKKGYFTSEQAERMRTLAVRSKGAATGLIIYLDSLPPRPPGLGRSRRPKEPKEPKNQEPEP